MVNLAEVLTNQLTVHFEMVVVAVFLFIYNKRGLLQEMMKS